MVKNLSRLAALLLLTATAACQSQEASHAEAPANTAQADVAANVPSPEANAIVANTLDGDALIAENKRIMAENQRTVETLNTHQQEDPIRFETVKTGCEQKVGVASDRDGAKRVSDCIDAAW